MSSSDLEERITQKVIQKKNTTSTKKNAKSKKVTVVAADHGKNEGDDPHWAYKPPKGAVLLDHAVDPGAFEWDTVHDDSDTEIWVIRVPESIKAKHLQGLDVHPLSSSSNTTRVGNMTRKRTTYDVWSIGTPGEDDDGELVGGDDLLGLSCLLPRKTSSGKLHVASKPISHHIVISARPSVATPAEHPPVVHRNPPRKSYPKSILKHAFVPYGARSEPPRSEDVSMDIDFVEVAVEKPLTDPKTSHKEPSTKTKELKGKKRKVEGDSPKHKKSKKRKGIVE